MAEYPSRKENPQVGASFWNKIMKLGSSTFRAVSFIHIMLLHIDVAVGPQSRSETLD
jgi:hypothetical protein